MNFILKSIQTVELLLSPKIYSLNTNWIRNNTHKTSKLSNEHLNKESQLWHSSKHFDKHL